MIKVMEYGKVPENRIFERSTSSRDVSDVVSAILADVRERGDQALRDYTLKFDGAAIDAIEVPKSKIKSAAEAMDEAFMDVLRKAADNIRDYHSRQKRESFVVS